ncbi:MAG: hypothetical protein LBV80_11355 [Deltaproteobacteria bacterium]|jgi:ATP-dependent Lon protease|nr:hypothetical protein [Deltaproteobacteria bacterium]
MIREKIYREIIATLDKHQRFESINFKIESANDQYGNTTLTITYIFEPKYMIIFVIPSSITKDKNGYEEYYTFSGNVCPGPLSYKEKFSFTGKAGMYERIFNWLDCIWEELSSNPIVKIIESQQQEINEIFEYLDKIEDNYFTKEEGLKLKQQLNEIEEKIKEQLKQNSNDKKIFEQEASKLHTDIDTLKQTICSFKKKGWAKNCISKILKWTKSPENKAMLEDGYTILREILPEEIKKALPEVS